MVLTIFINGLSYDFLEEQGLENIMPNTYKFFNKGTICKKCYTTGECTPPSVASICIGLNRKNINTYKEIYLKVSKEVLMDRDQKKLYS